jgi:hypothetical protein
VLAFHPKFISSKRDTGPYTGRERERERGRERGGGEGEREANKSF